METCIKSTLKHAEFVKQFLNDRKQEIEKIKLPKEIENLTFKQRFYVGLFLLENLINNLMKILEDEFIETVRDEFEGDYHYAYLGLMFGIAIGIGGKFYMLKSFDEMIEIIFKEGHIAPKEFLLEDEEIDRLRESFEVLIPYLHNLQMNYYQRIMLIKVIIDKPFPIELLINYVISTSIPDTNKVEKTLSFLAGLIPILTEPEEK